MGISGRVRLLAGSAALAIACAGCGATPAAMIIDACVVSPNSTCVHANLQAQDLSGQDVRGTDSSLADLRDADLRGANFAGANLFGANLAGAQVDAANFASANVIGTICPNGATAKGSPAACDDLPTDQARS